MSAPVFRLALRTAPYEGQEMAAALDAFVRDLPPMLFARRGVVIPVPVWEPEASVPGLVGILAAGDKVLGEFSLTDAQAAVALLEEHAADLLTPEMVAYFLVKLRASWPVLVRAVEQRFSVESLTEALRARLRRGDSIRDFAGTLEDLLAETC